MKQPKYKHHGAYSNKDGVNQLSRKCVYCGKKMLNHTLPQIFDDRLRQHSAAYGGDDKFIGLNIHAGRYEREEYEAELREMCIDLAKVAKVKLLKT